MIEDSIQVVVLACDEEKTIQTVINRTREVLIKNCLKFELVIFNDASTDGTTGILREIEQKNSHIKVIHNATRKGIGYLLKKAYTQSQADWTVIICSDMQFDPFDLELFFPYLEDFNIVISERHQIQEGFILKGINIIDKMLLRLLFSVTFKDLHWIKFVHKDSIYKPELIADSQFVEAEILLRAKKRGAKIKNILVPYYPRNYGVAKGANFANIYKTVQDMFNLYLRLR
jgi:glycosyltransferase involved in cell wall biosynthesis